MGIYRNDHQKPFGSMYSPSCARELIRREFEFWRLFAGKVPVLQSVSDASGKDEGTAAKKTVESGTFRHTLQKQCKEAKEEERD